MTRNPKHSFARNGAVVGLVAGSTLGLGGCAGHGKYTSAAIDNAQQRMGVMRATAEHDMALQSFLAGDLEKAQRGIDRAITLDPNSAESFALRGRVLIERGAIGEAIFSLKESLKLQPEQPDAHYYLGVAFERIRKPEDALTHFQLAAGLDPDDPQHTVAVAEILIDLGRTPEAREALLASVASEHSSGIKQLLGHIAILEGDPDSAVRELREASLLAANDAAIREDLATALVKAGRFSEADRELAALLAKPSHADRRDLMQVRARCLLAQSRPVEARNLLRKLVNDPAGEADAANWIALGEAAFVTGDHAELRRSAARAVSMAPQRPEGYVLWALWHQSKGDAASALLSIETGAVRAGGDEDLDALRILLLAQLGRDKDAAAALAATDNPGAMIDRLTILTDRLVRMSSP